MQNIHFCPSEAGPVSDCSSIGWKDLEILHKNITYKNYITYILVFYIHIRAKSHWVMLWAPEGSCAAERLLPQPRVGSREALRV